MAGGVSRTVCRAVVLTAVLLVVPAATQTLLNLLERVVFDLPALGRALKTPSSLTPSPTKFPHQSYNESAERYCFGELGCLETGADFYDQQYRPLNLQPEPRESLHVTFSVQSREDPEGVLVSALDLQQILKSSFKPNRKTKIIIHGYLNGRDMPWLEVIAHAFLRVNDYNVVMMDWTDGSLGLYEQAVANARVAGLEVAHLIHWLQDHTGHSPQDVHLIGHSLGAHVSGYAGERVSGLGRITGLDPAQPYFQHMPASVRLDPSDALFVDVIHTDSSLFSFDGGYGLREPSGHLDFYPNDGKYQPGCQPPLTAPLRWLLTGRNFTRAWHAVEDALGCSHIRSSLLFADSIVSQCPYTAFACQSYQQYRAGECFNCGEDGSRCAPMGIHADTWAGRGAVGLQLYLSTGPDPHFCLYHFLLTLELSQTPWGTMPGRLTIIFLSSTGHSSHFSLTTGYWQSFEPGKRYSFLLEHGEDLSSSVSAKLTWTAKGDHLCPTCDADLPPLSKLTLVNIENLSLSRERSDRPNARSSEAVFVASGEQVARIPGPDPYLTTTLRLVTSPT
ncbi:pancreatic triacylglycerol lipase [Procambarus clarkii]|uniref:pancreatic triacylglycerol lipase n=1 Tax=Procambarus clarkii TaxID=6728 RepID=UPI003742BAB8